MSRRLERSAGPLNYAETWPRIYRNVEPVAFKTPLTRTSVPRAPICSSVTCRVASTPACRTTKVSYCEPMLRTPRTRRPRSLTSQEGSRRPPSRFGIDVTDTAGNTHSLEITPQTYDGCRGL